MPRTSIPATIITRAGVAPPTPVAVDVANGNEIVNDGRTVLLVNNTNAASVARTLTVQIPGLIDGQTITPRTYPIPAAQSRYIGPFDPATYGSTLQVNGDNAELRVSPLRLA